MNLGYLQILLKGFNPLSENLRGNSIRRSIMFKKRFWFNPEGIKNKLYIYKTFSTLIC